MVTATDPPVAAPAARHNKSSCCNDAYPPDLVDEDSGVPPPVLVLVVRADAADGMDPVRIEMRCCSATLATYWAERDNAEVDIKIEWTKKVFTCDDDAALGKLASRARACGICAREFRDEETGERSLLALGPGTGSALTAVTDGSLARTFTDNTRAGEEEVSARHAETLRVTERVRHEYRLPAMKKKNQKPNDKCDCGSGLKFKKCCAGKRGVVALEDAVLAVLGNEVVTAPAGEGSSEVRDSSMINGNQRGEKVPGFRKQVEYGAKKYIKP